MNKYQEALDRLVSYASEDLRYKNEQLIDDCRELQELIGEQSKLEKALDKACKFIEDHYCSCPYDAENFCKHTEECDDNYAKCWKEWARMDDKEVYYGTNGDVFAVSSRKK